MTTLGSDHNGRRVSLTEKERMAHTHVIGNTGKGKSKVLQLLMRYDIQNPGCGLCLVDPHGSLYDEVMHDVAQSSPRLAKRVVLFDPARMTDDMLGFNPIPPDAKTNADFVRSMLVGACLKAWGQDNPDQTPRISRWLGNWFQILIDNRLTLVDLLPLMSTTNRFQRQRRKLVAGVRDPAVVEDCEMFEQSNQLQRQNLIEGPANRMGKFLRSIPIRNALGQQAQVLDLASIMDEGKILLVNLNGGNTISADNTRLLGTMLVNELFRVAKLRDPHDPRLKPFFLYIDEFANFVTRDVARALEECRKFRMFLILAHQHLAQLREEDEYLYASVMTNCENRIVFGGLSREDAELMADEVMTGFVDLKTVKDEVYTTKVRHAEETRTTRGRTTSSNAGQSRSEAESRSTGTSEGRSSSDSHGQTATTSRSTSQTQTVGHSDGTTQTDGRTVTDGQTVGETHGRSTTRGRSLGESTTQGHADNQSGTRTTGRSHSLHHGRSGSTSRQEGWSASESSGESTSSGHSDSNSEGRQSSNDPYALASSYNANEQHGRSENVGANESQTEGRSGSETKSTGWNGGRSQGESTSDGTTTGSSVSWSEARQRSATASESESDSKSHSQSHSTARTRSMARNHTDSVSSSTGSSVGSSQGRSHTQTQGRTTSRSTSEGRSSTRSQSTSESHGQTETVVPFLRPVEYRELSSRTFYSLPELTYAVVAAIKNQGVAQALVRTKTGRPQWIRIQRVTSTPYIPSVTPKRLAAFVKRVVAAHPELYLPSDEARRRLHERHINLFGEPLLVDDGPTPVIEIEAEKPDDDKWDPFT